MTMIPQAMREARRWITWRHLNGRKPPCDAEGKPLAQWTDPAGWLTYDEAWVRFRDFDPVDGIGFVLGEGWSGLDLDDCREVEGGALDHRAQAVLALVPTAYAEVSPSGKGIKIFGHGEGWVECNFRDAGRVRAERKATGYFCVTGEALEGRTEVPPLPLDAVLATFGAHQAEEEAGRKAAPPLPQVVPPGSQEPAMFREAARLRRLGYEVPEITAALWAMVRNGRFPNEPGREAWSEEDCRRKAESAERYDKTADTYDTKDTGQAEYFAAVCGDLVRYDWRRKRWLVFDDVRWRPDTTGTVFQLMLECARGRLRAAVAAGDKDRVKALVQYLNTGKINAALEAAQSHPRIRDVGDTWDREPFLLGVPNGVVDLRTGELRPGRPEDRITMQAGFPYDPKAQAPLWEATIAGIFARNGKPRPDFVAYVQRFLGYSMTGDCREEVFALCTGRLDSDEKSGRNGKGTMINTVARVLGEYADNLGFASLEWQRNGGGGAGAASPDLAKLTGKRFVTASETNKGAWFNSARIKAMTGRDPISARFLYGEEFTFVPEFKLWLSVNHPPRVEDDSLGFWSRPHVVEFPNTFATAPNTTLKDDLLAEGPGILAWLVRGALEWQRMGLNPPPEVHLAVRRYAEEQGDLPEFLDATCVQTPEARATFEEVRTAYLAWCRVERKRPMNSRELGRELRRRFGDPVQRKVGGRVGGHKRDEYHGVGLRAPAAQQEASDQVPF